MGKGDKMDLGDHVYLMTCESVRTGATYYRIPLSMYCKNYEGADAWRCTHIGRFVFCCQQASIGGASADPKIFQHFRTYFVEAFGQGVASAVSAFDFAREWLAAYEQEYSPQTQSSPLNTGSLLFAFEFGSNIDKWIQDYSQALEL